MKSENNEPIKSAMAIGLEINLLEIDTKIGIKISTPLGIEYFSAESNTTHAYAEGSVIVDWKIPIMGFVIAPEISIDKLKILYVRPLGIGYYNLGKLWKARLIVADRPGRLEASSDSIGISSVIGIRYSKDIFNGFIEGGYRWLAFTDVFLDPKNGFTESVGGALVQPGYLKESLDYSGAFIRIGIMVKI